MKQILLMIAVVAVVAVVAVRQTKDSKQYAPADFNKDGIVTLTESKKFQRERGDYAKPNQTVTAAKNQSEIIEKAIRRHLHAKTGFAAGKEIKGEFTKADLDRVTGLDFTRTKINDEGLKEVVTKLPKLTSLSFWMVKTISDEDIKELAKLQQLTRINLDSTQITDAGLKVVAKMKQLQELDLENTKVTKAGVDELMKALPNCKIEHTAKK